MTPTFLLAVALAQAQDWPDVTRPLANGSIDWTSYTLVVVKRSDRTVGAWKDRRVQEQDALDALGPLVAETAGAVPLTPETTAGDLVGGGNELGLRISDGMGAWRVAETRYHSAGAVELQAELDLMRWLRPALMELGAEAVPSTPARGPTGLVVDARGLPFTPTLAPRVTTPSGSVIMQAQSVGIETLRAGTPVLYVTDPADPRAALRAGERPLFGRAASANGGELVLDPTTAGVVGGNPGTPLLVYGGKVVVVVDP